MSPVYSHIFRRWMAAAWLVAVLAAGPLFAGSPATGLAGAVKDSSGRLLDGVELLVVPTVAAVQPLATVLSDASGRFVIPQLVPGVYRLAAIKSGYITWIAQVDTRAKRWVDVILRPAPLVSEEQTLPEDSSWALRLPRRTVFRDTDPDLPESSAPVVFVASESGSAPRPVSMQVDHLIAVSPLGSGDRSVSELSGSETSLRVSTALGDKGSLRVRGRLQNLDSTSGESARSAGAQADTSEFNVDFSYATGVDGRVDVSAWYGLRDLAWTGFSVGAPLSLQQAQRSWGYRSRWQKQIDSTSNVVVRMAYDDRDSSVRRNAIGEAAELETPGMTLDGRLASRSVEVDGLYTSQVSSNHRVEAGFAARRIETPGLDLLGGSRPTWSFEASSQDSWTLSRPLTLIYGVAYQHAISETDAALFVPRAGASWNLERVMFRFLVSYHAVTHWETSDATRIVGSMSQAELPEPSRRLDRPEGDIGYAGSVEIALSDGFSLEGSTSYSPLQLGGVEGVRGEELGEVPLYLADGPAAVGEARLTFSHETGRTRAYFEIARGEVEGVLAPLQPYALVAEQFVPGALTYTNGRWGLRVIPAGTDLQFEYRRIGGTRSDSGRSIPEQTILELRVTQDLMRLEELGSWRLLMAVRMGSLDKADLESPVEDYVTVGALNSGVSAGVSVTF